jgi:hypothetical protein
MTQQRTTSNEPLVPRAPLDIRQRSQGARTRMATISSDIRQYFPGIGDGMQNPSDINQPTRTRIDTQRRSPGHTCRRSESNLSYME